MRAHIAIHHSKNKSKAEARQARMLDVELNYAPLSRSNGNYYYYYYCYFNDVLKKLYRPSSYMGKSEQIN